MEIIKLDNDKMKKVIEFIIKFQLPIIVTVTGSDIAFEEPVKIVDFTIHPRLTKEYSEKMIVRLSNKTRLNLKSFTDKFEITVEYKNNTAPFTSFIDIEISNIKDKTDTVDFPVVFSVAFNRGTNFEMTILKLLEIIKN